MPTVSPAKMFSAFLRLGATAYGGPGMMGQLQAEVVGRRRWVSGEDFREGVALCQAIPGATMVQMCAYLGYRLHGVPGALLAATAFMLPAFTAMVLLSAAYVYSAPLPMARSLFRGLGAVVVAIVLDACLRLGPKTLRGWRDTLVAACALVAMFYRVNFVVILAGSAALAIALSRVSRRPPSTPLPGSA